MIIDQNSPSEGELLRWVKLFGATKDEFIRDPMMANSRVADRMNIGVQVTRIPWGRQEYVAAIHHRKQNKWIDVHRSDTYVGASRMLLYALYEYCNGTTGSVAHE